MRRYRFRRSHRRLHRGSRKSKRVKADKRSRAPLKEVLFCSFCAALIFHFFVDLDPCSRSDPRNIISFIVDQDGSIERCISFHKSVPSLRELKANTGLVRRAKQEMKRRGISSQEASQLARKYLRRYNNGEVQFIKHHKRALRRIITH